jgi:hypothetical protein
MKRLLLGLKNILLWSYERGTWQYDLLCILIIASVFLLPSSFFGDRDRDRPLQAAGAPHTQPQANEALKVASNPAETTQWEIGVAELSAFWQNRSQSEPWVNHPQEVIVLYLTDRLKRPVTLEQHEAQRDARGQITGYRVRFR